MIAAPPSPAPVRSSWLRTLLSRLLTNDMVERVLTKLGMTRRPEPSLHALREIYSRWCTHVPFDNVRKLIHLRSGFDGPLPGTEPGDFFTAWLRHGTGGTCWAGSGGLHALLSSLGFESSRGIATMMNLPEPSSAKKELPPNHGIVTVAFGPDRYLVDTAMLHGEPVLLNGDKAAIEHPAWGLRCHQQSDHRWLIRWRPMHKVDGFACRLERFTATAEDFRRQYDQTRGWSPFNCEVYARLNRGGEVKGLAFGHAVNLHAGGTAESIPATHAERRRILIEDLGMSEEIVSCLPEDIPTPAPPQE